MKKKIVIEKYGLDEWERYKKYSKEYGRKYKKKIRMISLLSGNEENYGWRIALFVDSKGCIRKRYPFILENDDMKKYSAIRRKKNPLKQIHLGFYYEDGYTFTLKQSISKEGRIYGIGYFGSSISSSDKKERYQHHLIKNLIVLNEYTKGFDLHHLSQNIAIFIPRKLHQSIYHDLKKNINMNKINEKALEFWDWNVLKKLEKK